MKTSLDRRGSRPNLLFILDDQHRFDYLGAMGAGFLSTPNLDRLARRGVLFTQCATSCPVCAPSRIGLATGAELYDLENDPDELYNLADDRHDLVQTLLGQMNRRFVEGKWLR